MPLCMGFSKVLPARKRLGVCQGGTSQDLSSLASWLLHLGPAPFSSALNERRLHSPPQPHAAAPAPGPALDDCVSCLDTPLSFIGPRPPPRPPLAILSHPCPLGLPPLLFPPLSSPLPSSFTPALTLGLSCLPAAERFQAADSARGGAERGEPVLPGNQVLPHRHPGADARSGTG